MPNPGHQSPSNARLRVSVAYDLPSGNPLKKWSPFDFDLGKDMLELRGDSVEVKRLAGNVLDLKVLGDKFAFGADGFDLHRDLFIRIDELDAVTGEEVAES